VLKVAYNGPGVSRTRNLSATSPILYHYTTAPTLIDVRLLVWLCGDTLVSINVVTLRRARLVPGWVTVFGWVNHLGTEPCTHVYSA